MVILMKKYNNKIDILLILFILIFMFISITTIYSANTYLPSYLGNLALKQFSYYIISFIIIYFIIKFKNKYVFKFIDILYFIGITSLLLLLIFGTSINGSKCWFVIPFIGSIQPSEFMKFILIIKLSIDINNYFYKNKTGIKDEFKFILKELIIILIPSILTFLEPDTGAVLMYLLSSLILFIISPFHKRWIVIISIITITVLSIFIYLYFFNNSLFIDIVGTDIFYRIERIINWKNGTGMQLENSLISIGSSGYFGHGYNKTPLYFPESGTDFIFSVFASNFGLIGSIILVIIILLFDLYLLIRIIKSKTILHKLIITGTLSIFIYQQIQNIGMTLGILPITGITLPFISYGGSSLVSNMIMIGIILNILKQEKKNIVEFK